MKYEVKLNGTVVMTTSSPECRPSEEMEYQMQQDGYALYEDGKKKKMIKKPRSSNKA